MPRYIEAEWLDRLPVDEPSALSSRDDLRRLNAIMGHPGLVARILGREPDFPRMQSIVDLGGGDGTFLLALARKLPQRASAFTGTIVDPHGRVAEETRRGLEAAGCKLSVIRADAIEFLSFEPPRCDVIIGNLFLHHLSETALVRLMSHITQLTPLFIACEPHRGSFPLLASRLLGIIGCNHITRHDAPASVRAGFRQKELSFLWPARTGWHLQEYRAGPFSHCFIARHVA
jgi:SAM-dependent methyltransferase